MLTMLQADELRERASKYRADAKHAADSRTRELYCAVAQYLDTWAAQIERAKEVVTEASPERQAG
jgi:hypothetical protein